MNLRPLRTARALYGLVTLLRDPDELPQVFEMAEALGTPEALATMIRDIERDPKGARALAERPRLRVDLEALRALPAGTLGHEFAVMMDTLGLDPAALPELPSPDAASFVRAHLTETHDLWHLVTGFGVDWKGEIGLQAFYLAQLPTPLAATLVAVGCLRVARYEMDRREDVMAEVVRGWELGKRAEKLFGVRWDELWAVPLEDVRARLGLSTPIAAAA